MTCFIWRVARVCSLLLTFFVLGCCTAWSQNLGSLHGNVTDPSNAVIAGATVTVTNTATSALRTAQTDSVGAYDFSQLAPGIYSVQVSKTGFKTFVQQQVTVLVATPTTLNVRLQIGAASQQVTVEAATVPSLNTEDATVGTAFDPKQVQSLPFLARNVVNLLTLQPGVVFTGMSDTDLLSMGTNQGLDTREGSVDGIRGNQTNVTVDGVDANDWQNQSPFTSALPITLDSVQEFRVITTNSNATDSGVGGPQVALSTRSGTNTFHGNVRWYYRTSGTAANPFFNNQTGLPRPKLQRQIPGGSLGGPIKKDRMFFFLDTEERREASTEAAGPRNVGSDTLRDGVLVYQCQDPTDARCQGSTVQGLNFAHQIPAGAFGLSPAQFQSLDPAGTGVNPAMIAYLNLFPQGNDVPASLDNGLSFNAFVFNAGIPRTSAIQTARVDYNLTKDGRHSLMVRGSLGDYHVALLDAQFPGQAPASELLNNSKGIAVQYQGQFSSNLTNTLRYGFTRLGVELTGQTGDQFDLRSFSDLVNFTRGNSHRTPVHEVGDDLVYVHGAHVLQFGGSLTFIRNKRTDLALSFPSFVANNGFCFSLCDDMVAAINGGTTFPAVGDPTLFERAMMALTGSITQVSATFLADPKSGAILPSGTPEQRQFDTNYYNLYAQDSWHVRPSLTVTAGMQYGYETPPWEANGFEVTPSFDIEQWFQQRVVNMNNGIPSDASPLLSWSPAGKANGSNSWYRPDYRNISPRLAVAYSPTFSNGIRHFLFGEGKSSIRAGAGIYYDRIGQALALDSDLNGSPGTATALINGSQDFDFADAPRFSGSCTSAGICTGLPPLSQFLQGIPTTATFPFTPVANASNVGFAVDPNLRTPYSIHLDASFQRELPGKFVVDVGYVGTLGRRLLGKQDYAQYLDLRDPQSGTDLWSAYRKIVNIIGTPGSPSISPTLSNGEPNVAGLAQIAAIPYFQNLMPNMGATAAAFLCDPSDTTCNTGYQSLTPTQAFYAFVTQDTVASWSCALFPIDLLVGPGGAPSPWNSTVDPQGDGFVLFQQQFSSLPGWAGVANSNYHSLQVSVRKSTGPATFGFNYVLSHSIDNASTAENADNIPGTNGTLTGLIQNPFDLRAGRASSDFDLRHDFNGNWVVSLPFGKGRRLFSSAGSTMDRVIGGWEISGLARWRSGFLQSPGNGFNFPTNFFLTTPGTAVASIETHVVRNVTGSAAQCALISCGTPNLFRDPAGALNDVAFTGPGLSGSRNIWRGPAYFDMDAGIAKSIELTEKERLQFRMTAFNVFNNVNFADSQSLDPTSPNTFGEFVSTAGPRGGAREVEFAVRLEF